MNSFKQSVVKSTFIKEKISPEIEYFWKSWKRRKYFLKCLKQQRILSVMSYEETMSNYTMEDVTNSTGNFTDQIIDFDDPFYNIFVILVFSTLYIIIFFMGMYGNFLVCFVVLRNKTMQTVTNFFITNLALADMLLCLFCITLTPTYTILRKWIFGEFLCHSVAFLQCFCVYLSTLTLTSIAVDRFFVIVYPFRPRMKVCTCLLILLFIWISSCLLTMPYGYYMEVKSHAYALVCDEDWPTEDIRWVMTGNNLNFITHRNSNLWKNVIYFFFCGGKWNERLIVFVQLVHMDGDENDIHTKKNSKKVF